MKAVHCDDDLDLGCPRGRVSSLTGSTSRREISQKILDCTSCQPDGSLSRGTRRHARSLGAPGAGTAWRADDLRRR